jgi:hypothetical protein
LVIGSRVGKPPEQADPAAGSRSAHRLRSFGSVTDSRSARTRTIVTRSAVCTGGLAACTTMPRPRGLRRPRVGYDLGERAPHGGGDEHDQNAAAKLRRPCRPGALRRARLRRGPYSRPGTAASRSRRRPGRTVPPCQGSRSSTQPTRHRTYARLTERLSRNASAGRGAQLWSPTGSMRSSGSCIAGVLDVRALVSGSCASPTSQLRRPHLPPLLRPARLRIRAAAARYRDRPARLGAV